MHRLMLPLLLLAAIALVTLGLLHVRAAAPEPVPPQSPAAAPPPAPFAVVELFTSEGCSSCPPADRVLAALAAEAQASGRRVYPLSFHVDYWNYLGWADPYSDAAHSQRQRTYAGRIRSRVYTPQMIVNGRNAFVGSREGLARRYVADALATPGRALVEIETAPAEAGYLGVRYRVEEAPAGAVVHLALVQHRLSQDVPRGENAGRTLPHANVVRAFHTAEATAGLAVLRVPDDLALDDASLIAYVQDPATMAILGATGREASGAAQR